jgi:hypothetical protein
MSETLLSPSQVKLYGRPFEGFEITTPKTPGPPPDPTHDLLTNQLRRADARFARIYGFSYEGNYCALPRPTVFLVHGPGCPVEPGWPGTPTQGVDTTGTANRDWAFDKDIRYWEYDRVNYSLRCDIVSGTLDEILIEAAGRSGGNLSARSDMASRSDLSARSDLTSRSYMTSRSDMASRSDLTSRHRIR